MINNNEQEDLILIKQWCNITLESEEQWIDFYKLNPNETMKCLKSVNTPCNYCLPRLLILICTIAFIIIILFYLITNSYMLMIMNIIMFILLILYKIEKMITS